MSDLQTMVPQPVVVKVGDEEIQIRALRVGQVSAVLYVIKPLAPQLAEYKKTGSVDVLSLVVENTPAVINLLAILLSKPKEWVEDLELDSMVKLVSAVLEVNLDFFIQRVLPSVLKAMGQLNALSQEVPSNLTGRLPSKN